MGALLTVAASGKCSGPEAARLAGVPASGRRWADGSSPANINGRAAAIECYPDFGPSPRFRWSNDNHHIEAYQGELIDKDNYKRAFLYQSGVLAGRL